VCTVKEKMRVVVLNKYKCNPKKCGLECYKFCPRVRTGDETIIIKEGSKPVINESLCVGCGICAKRCPFNALSVINLPKELEKNIVHQYGENGFRLFKFPIPRKGQVIGLLGENGIGKTTILNVLSGLLVPNLGFYNIKKEGLTSQEHKINVIDYFKGSESQNYFKELYSGKLRVSVKPQHVELIPKQFNGVVNELLTKTNERENMNEWVEKLGLNKVLDKRVDELSGGELQRLAICASILKKSDAYFFDEPSSYLDVEQRLMVARVIRELVNEDVYVIVVEHDLIMLDYLTDVVHVVYGEASKYGIVSAPMNSREGINSYINGFLREENTRFRDSRLKFDEGVKTGYREEEVLIKWGEMSKEFPGFKLIVNPGDVRKNEIIGVIGPNGIGKTTFARLLSGRLKPDAKNADKVITEDVIISYKPQYISSDSEKTVMTHLLGVSDEFHTAEYRKSILEPLSIHSLLNKKLCELSGGELQRVKIAECLSRKASVYLLDEPSAHLDVQQRINCANVIKDVVSKKGACALVIDHDLMLVDYLCNRVLLFTGERGVKGETKGPLLKENGMNALLEFLRVTFRRDNETNRPRANKPGSFKDREQKSQGRYYY